MPNMEMLGSVVSQLHYEFQKIYFLMLPVCFALSIALSYFRHPTGSIEFLDILKRAFVTTLLLVAFQDIANSILYVSDGIASKIDDLKGLDDVMKMAAEKASSYSSSPMSALLQINDLIISALSYGSYLVLYLARYITVALYNFFWVFLVVTSPLILLFGLFPSTSHIVKNMFQSMMEVASWKIAWASAPCRRCVEAFS